MSQLTKTRAAEILEMLRDRNVVVLGDVMLDEFVWGDVTRISPEAPVPVVDVRRESVHLGGAANVLANLVALGARGSVVGVVGNDAAGERLQNGLRELGTQDGCLIVDESRPSTTKTRIIAHSQLVVRADRESRIPVNGKLEEKIVSCLKDALKEADAFVVSDYDKGVVTPAHTARDPAARLRTGSCSDRSEAAQLQLVSSGNARHAQSPRSIAHERQRRSLRTTDRITPQK